MTLTEKLAALLTEAGLPSERELFGKPFAFTYRDDNGKMVRISATITGFQLSERFFKTFELQTSSTSRIAMELLPALIRFTGANMGSSPLWVITYRVDPMCPNGETEHHKGEFELL
jgi:hypothetical protein